MQLAGKAGNLELQGDVFVSIASTGVLNADGLELAGKHTKQCSTIQRRDNLKASVHGMRTPPTELQVH